MPKLQAAALLITAAMFPFVSTFACAPASPPQAPMTPTEVAVGSVTSSSSSSTAPPVEIDEQPVTEERMSDDLPSLPNPAASAFLGPPPTPPMNGGGTPSTSSTSSGVAPFDRGAAAHGLSIVNVQACATANGPTGVGHATVTFDPGGTVSSVSVDSGPFPGTAVGACIAGRFQAVHVPPFGGAPVRVGKSFSLGSSPGGGNPASPPSRPFPTAVRPPSNPSNPPPSSPPCVGAGCSQQPFDRGAAAQALGGVNAQKCATPNGPTGSGHATVTFEPSGKVSSAIVDAGPFPGTPVGGCIAGLFRTIRIPAFTGTSVRVGKAFTVN